MIFLTCAREGEREYIFISFFFPICTPEHLVQCVSHTPPPDDRYIFIHSRLIIVKNHIKTKKWKRESVLDFIKHTHFFWRGSSRTNFLSISSHSLLMMMKWRKCQKKKRYCSDPWMNELSLLRSPNLLKRWNFAAGQQQGHNEILVFQCGNKSGIHSSCTPGFGWDPLSFALLWWWWTFAAGPWHEEERECFSFWQKHSWGIFEWMVLKCTHAQKIMHLICPCCWKKKRTARCSWALREGVLQKCMQVVKWQQGDTVNQVLTMCLLSACSVCVWQHCVMLIVLIPMFLQKLSLVSLTFDEHFDPAKTFWFMFLEREGQFLCGVLIERLDHCTRRRVVLMPPCTLSHWKTLTRVVVIHWEAAATFFKCLFFIHPQAHHHWAFSFITQLWLAPRRRMCKWCMCVTHCFSHQPVDKKCFKKDRQTKNKSVSTCPAKRKKSLSCVIANVMILVVFGLGLFVWKKWTSQFMERRGRWEDDQKSTWVEFALKVAVTVQVEVSFALPSVTVASAVCCSSECTNTITKKSNRLIPL